jgi:hypothetical protein
MYVFPIMSDQRTPLTTCILKVLFSCSGELPVSPEQGMCGRPSQQEQMSVLPATEMPEAGNESRW